jgi:hypothetical protein
VWGGGAGGGGFVDTLARRVGDLIAGVFLSWFLLGFIFILFILFYFYFYYFKKNLWLVNMEPQGFNFFQLFKMEILAINVEIFRNIFFMEKF